MSAVLPFPLRMLVLVADLFVVGTALHCPSAFAQGTGDRCLNLPACRSLSEQALLLYRDQRYYDAWRLLKQAYVMSQEPRLLVNLGRCLDKLGQVQEALAAYQQFLKDDALKDAAEQQRVQRYIDELKPRRDITLPLPSPSAVPSVVGRESPPPEGPATRPPPASSAALVQRGADALPTAGAVSAEPRLSRDSLAPPASPLDAGAASPPPQLPPSRKPDSQVRRPLVRRPWFWVGVGSALVALSVGLGVGLGLPQTPKFHRLEW